MPNLISSLTPSTTSFYGDLTLFYGQPAVVDGSNCSALWWANWSPGGEWGNAFAIGYWTFGGSIGVTSYYDEMIVIAYQAGQNLIYTASWQLGESGGEWVDWGELDKATTNSSPALAQMGNNLYMVYPYSGDNTLYWAYSPYSPNGAWGTPAQIQVSDQALTTSEVPALASCDGSIYLLYTEGGNIYGASLADGSWNWLNGGHPVVSSGLVSSGPSLASSGSTLCMTYQLNDGMVGWCVFDGSSWHDLGAIQVPGGISTSSGTALAVSMDNIYLLYLNGVGQVCQAALGWSNQGAILTQTL